MKKRSMSFASGKGSNSSNIESVDVYYSDDEDEVGFSEGEPDLKNAVAAFNFAMDIPAPEKDLNKSIPEPKDTKQNVMAANESMGTKVKGLTPPIDNEAFTVKRCYQFRPSTIRKLNEIKARHPDMNVYLNTVLDEAILHYYNYMFKPSETL